MDDKDNSSSVVTYTMRYDGYTNMLTCQKSRLAVLRR